MWKTLPTRALRLRSTTATETARLRRGRWRQTPARRHPKHAGGRGAWAPGAPSQPTMGVGTEPGRPKPAAHLTLRGPVTTSAHRRGPQGHRSSGVGRHPPEPRRRPPEPRRRPPEPRQTTKEPPHHEAARHPGAACGALEPTASSPALDEATPPQSPVPERPRADAAGGHLAPEGVAWFVPSARTAIALALSQPPVKDHSRERSRGQLELHGPRGLLRDATGHSCPVSIQTWFFQTARAHVPSPGAPPRLLHPPLRDTPPWGRAAVTQRQASATAGAHVPPRSSAVRVNCLECFSQQPITTGPQSVLLSERSTKPPQRLPHPCPPWIPHPRLMLMK